MEENNVNNGNGGAIATTVQTPAPVANKAQAKSTKQVSVSIQPTVANQSKSVAMNDFIGTNVASVPSVQSSNKGIATANPSTGNNAVNPGNASVANGASTAVSQNIKSSSGGIAKNGINSVNVQTGAKGVPATKNASLSGSQNGNNTVTFASKQQNQYGVVTKGVAGVQNNNKSNVVAGAPSVDSAVDSVAPLGSANTVINSQDNSNATVSSNINSANSVGSFGGATVTQMQNTQSASVVGGESTGTAKTQVASGIVNDVSPKGSNGGIVGTSSSVNSQNAIGGMGTANTVVSSNSLGSADVLTENKSKNVAVGTVKEGNTVASQSATGITSTVEVQSTNSVQNANSAMQELPPLQDAGTQTGVVSGQVDTVNTNFAGQDTSVLQQDPSQKDGNAQSLPTLNPNINSVNADRESKQDDTSNINNISNTENTTDAQQQPNSTLSEQNSSQNSGVGGVIVQVIIAVVLFTTVAGATYFLANMFIK